MATKNITTKKQTKSKRNAGKKTTMKKAVRNKLAKRRGAPKKKLAQQKARPKKSAVKTVRGKSRSADSVAVALRGRGGGVDEQPGDSQGISNVASADSESVDELLEEGNTFEAEAVKGVEDAGDADEEEVRTHEVPEDDVPGEYLEKE
jgi:N utilization substance protein A